MTRLFARRAIVAGLATCAPMSTQAATVLWQGTAVVDEVSTTFPDTCTQYGSRLAAGTQLRVVFRPRGIGDNGIATRMIFIDGDKVSVILLPAGIDFTGNVTNAVSYVISDGGGDGISYGAKVEQASTWPASPSAATQRIILKGWVGSIFASCKVRFTAYLLRKS